MKQKCETCRVKHKYRDCFLDLYRMIYIEYKCLRCNKSYQQKLDEKLKKRFFNRYKFSNHDNKKFILFLQTGVYSYEYMNDWEKFNETSLPEKEVFIVT